jgi:hypothetical protein
MPSMLSGRQQRRKQKPVLMVTPGQWFELGVLAFRGEAAPHGPAA